MIGIIVAEEKELIEVKNKMFNIEEINLYEKIFYKGLIKTEEVLVVKSNVGKVNAARVTQMMIDKFNIKFIINVGTAGSLDNRLDIGDIVVSENLVQYDFDVTPFGRKLGEIENIGEDIKVDKNILDIFKELNVFTGCIATGDKFIVDKAEKEILKKEFNALCIEMEGASIAQVCKLNNVPFIVIRSITDKKDGSSKIEFNTFLESSSKKAAELLSEIIDKLPMSKKENNKIYFHIPEIDEFDYYENLLKDPKTMSYNSGYDLNIEGYDKQTGCINIFNRERWYTKLINDKNRYFAYVMDKKNNIPVGYVNFHFDEQYLKHSCGVVIQDKYRNLGYGEYALKELLNIAFNEYNLNSLIDTIPYNRSCSLKLFTKAGFKDIKKDFFIKKFDIDERVLVVELTKEDYIK